MASTAREIIRQNLQALGLPATMAPELYQRMLDGESPAAIRQTIIEALPGNRLRAQAGKPMLDPQTYLRQRERYLGVVRSFGLPPGFYDQPEDVGNWIAGDVSPAEVSRRIQERADTLRQHIPAVQEQFITHYGVRPTDGVLLAHAIDPKRAKDALQAEFNTPLRVKPLESVTTPDTGEQVGP